MKTIVWKELKLSTLEAPVKIAAYNILKHFFLLLQENNIALNRECHI